MTLSEKLSSFRVCWSSRNFEEKTDETNVLSLILSSSSSCIHPLSRDAGCTLFNAWNQIFNVCQWSITLAEGSDHIRSSVVLIDPVIEEGF